MPLRINTTPSEPIRRILFLFGNNHREEVIVTFTDLFINDWKHLSALQVKQPEEFATPGPNQMVVMTDQIVVRSVDEGLLCLPIQQAPLFTLLEEHHLTVEIFDLVILSRQNPEIPQVDQPILVTLRTGCNPMVRHNLDRAILGLNPIIPLKINMMPVLVL